jgi:hypothetical protein
VSAIIVHCENGVIAGLSQKAIAHELVSHPHNSDEELLERIVARGFGAAYVWSRR